jgi:lipopolysaccharide transport system ATP-binding protein
MSDTTLAFEKVWKKFARGEKFDSLRDLVPSLGRWLFSPNHRDQLREKEFWALRDVSFELQRGQALGIIGPNGSGKTTALKLLSSILKPDLGFIGVRGRLGALIELGAGFHPDLTGRENIYLNGTILGMKRSEIERKFDEIVEFSGLSEFLDTPVKRYSSGMYARLGFSVAAHVDPEILLIDEVLSVGDYHFQQKCFNKMREFVRKGTSVVFVSHDLTAVTTLCTQALLLRYGVPVYYGDVATAIQKYHSFYEEQTSSSEVEIFNVQATSARGGQRDVFEPGEDVTFEIGIKALKDIRNSHAGLLIHTINGQRVFLTASSRLTDKTLNLSCGESARVRFRLQMNLQGGVFLLGFTISQDVEVPDQWIYYNPRLKKVVVRDPQTSQGYVYMNPRVEMLPAEADVEACVQAEE